MSPAAGIDGAFVRLRVADEHYALPIAEAREVIELGRIDAVPGAPASALGIRAVRGKPLPVFDLAQLLDGRAGDSGREQILVADHGSGQLGLAVDEVLDVTELPLDRGEAEADGLRSTVLDDGVLIGVIDLDALIARLER